jgi:hypothetical protein
MEREEMSGTNPFWYEAEATRLKVELIKATELIKALEDIIIGVAEDLEYDHSAGIESAKKLRAALEVKP